MNFKNKFHLTLVVLITLVNSLLGVSPTDTANALTLDNQNVNDYNKAKGAGVIYNIYNNINIKYITVKLYNAKVHNYLYAKKVNLQSVLSYKDNIEILMYSIKEVESHGRYKAKSQWSDACGAYQYMPITWDNYKGFKNACLAPEWAQDSRMRGEIKYLWHKYHDWQKVIASHYMPGYAYNKKLWNTHYFKGQPTINQYVYNVEQIREKLVAGYASV